MGRLEISKLAQDTLASIVSEGGMVGLHEIGYPQFYPVRTAGQTLGDHILPERGYRCDHLGRLRDPRRRRVRMGR